MTARILVVDDTAATRKLLEVRLTSEYFEALTAANGADALKMCEGGLCDIVLLDDKMPGMDGFEVCRRLKGQAATAHLPVIMVCALEQPGDRLRALQAGADDFMAKPLDDAHLVARIRSLCRVKSAFDELRLRAGDTARGKLAEFSKPGSEGAGRGRVLIVDDAKNSAERLAAALSLEHAVEIEANVHEAMLKAAEGKVDIVVVKLAAASYDALRLCSQIRALEPTRRLPLLAIAQPEERGRMLRALEIGVNDIVCRPVDAQELAARVRTQMRLKRYAEELRSGPPKPAVAARGFLFVSHVSEDFPVAIAIVEDLHRRGVRCWIAPRDIRPGQPFDDEISTAIDDCSALLLVFSDRCNESDYVRRELTVAGDAGKLIVPVRIENVQPKRGLRLRLSDLHWIDAFHQRDLAIERLVEIVGGLG